SVNFKLEISNLRFGSQVVAVLRPGPPARLRLRLRRGISSRSEKMVGVTGLEPVTPRLSSACSNQLSYTPWRGEARISNRPFEISNTRFEISKRPRHAVFTPHPCFSLERR